MNRNLGLLIPVLLFISVFLGFVPLPVHAVSPTYDSSANASFFSSCSGGVTTCTTSMGVIPSNSPELVVVAVAYGCNGQAGCVKASPALLNAPTNSLSYPVTLAMRQISEYPTGTVGSAIAFYYFTATAVTSFTITETTTASVGQIEIVQMLFLNAVVNVAAADYGGCDSNCSTSISLRNPIAFNSNAVIVSYEHNIANAAGSNITPALSCNGGAWSYVSGSANNLNMANCIEASGSSTSTAWTLSAPLSALIETVDFEATPLVTQVVPCNFSQVQCWIYPVFFLGMYDAFYLVGGIIARVSTKGLIYLLLSGFVMGSIVGLLMGFLAIQLVIASLVTLIIWFWRFH